MICFLRERFFPESPEHLASIVVGTGAKADKSNYYMKKLSEALQSLHDMPVSESVSRARSSVAIKVKDSEAMLMSNYDSEDMLKKYWWSIILALGSTGGFALTAGVTYVTLSLSLVCVSNPTYDKSLSLSYILK